MAGPGDARADGGHATVGELGGYRIQGMLGSGGAGSVYRAVDADGVPVALKVLHPHLARDDEARTRLSREVRSLQRLQHPGVARVLDAEVDTVEPFIVTELIDGPSLEDEISSGGPLEASDLFELADQLHDALVAVHEAGLVHRDLKPANILIGPEGPVLIDFGISQALADDRLTVEGSIMGTPGYLAPELLDGGDPTPASDWWGWASCLAFAATGRAPFGTRPVAAVMERMREDAPDLTGLGEITSSCLAGALRSDPRRRWSPNRVVGGLHHAWAQGEVPSPAGHDGTGDAGTADAVRSAAGRPAAVTGVVPGGGAMTGSLGGTGVVGTGRLVSAATPADPPGTVTGPVPEGGLGGALAEVPGVSETSPTSLPWGVGEDDGLSPTEQVDVEDLLAAGRGRRDLTARRPLTLGAVALALAALGALRPVPALLALVALVVLARTADGVLTARDLRRERGRTRLAPVLTMMTLPWHVARSVAGVTVAVAVGSCAAILGGVLLWWLLGTGLFSSLAGAPDAGTAAEGAASADRPWAYGLVLGVSTLAGAAVMWFGPGGVATRRGGRILANVLAPVPFGGVAVVALAAVAVWLVAAAVLEGRPVDWWPVPEALRL